MKTIQWSALEYEEKERSSDWFWALGIIVFTAGAAAIIYGNYFFATLIILSGVLLGFFATRKPELVQYELNDKGFVSHTSLYPYENIKSFWVQRETFPENDAEKLKPILFIHTTRLFMPIILTPIENSMTVDIRNLLLENNVLEEEMKETFAEKIMEALGF